MAKRIFSWLTTVLLIFGVMLFTIFALVFDLINVGEFLVINIFWYGVLLFFAYALKLKRDEEGDSES